MKTSDIGLKLAPFPL